MIRQRFREERSSLGPVLRPVAQVVLERDSFAVEIPMYIDSGADISVIPFRFGKALGFIQEQADSIRELRGITRAEIRYIIKEVKLVLNEKRLNVRIAWSLEEDVPILMGRMDIFDKFRIIFDQRSGWIDFEE